MYECMEPKQYACLEGSELSPIYMLDRVPEPGEVSTERSHKSKGGRGKLFLSMEVQNLHILLL